jgi:hypothetical protein
MSLTIVERADVRHALETKFSETLTQYNADNSTSITAGYDNVKFDIPSDGSAFIRFTITWSSTPDRIANDMTRQAGVAIAQVCTPLGTGLNLSNSITDAIERAFDYQNWEGESLRVTETATTDVGNEENSAYWIENVNIYFRMHK